MCAHVRAAWGEEQLLDGGLESPCSCTSSPLTGLSSRAVSCSALSPSCSGCPRKMPEGRGCAGCSTGLKWLLPPAWGTGRGLRPGSSPAWRCCGLRLQSVCRGAGQWCPGKKQVAISRETPGSGPRTLLACPHRIPLIEAQPCTLKAGCPSPGSEHGSLCPPGVDTVGFSVMFILSLQVVLRTQAEPVKNA